MSDQAPANDANGYAHRTLVVQLVATVLGTLIGSGILGLLGWNAVTSMETKEAVTRLEERTSNVTSTFRDLGETIAETRELVQRNDLRLREHDSEIQRNTENIRRLREDWVMPYLTRERDPRAPSVDNGVGGEASP